MPIEIKYLIAVEYNSCPISDTLRDRRLDQKFWVLESGDVVSIDSTKVDAPGGDTCMIFDTDGDAWNYIWRMSEHDKLYSDLVEPAKLFRQDHRRLRIKFALLATYERVESDRMQIAFRTATIRAYKVAMSDRHILVKEPLKTELDLFWKSNYVYPSEGA